MATTYKAETPQAVRDVLEKLRGTRTRVRIWYGDTETGEAWPDEFMVTGYIGRSMGPTKIPLLIHNRRSLGGPGMLDHCIVRIDTTDGQTLYKHPNFDPGTWENNGELIYHNGKFWGQNSSAKSAKRLCEFMRGERYSK